MVENPLLASAGRFHGHIGPFLALGLKIGLMVNEMMGRSPFETKAIVRVSPNPPRSCLVDGIQFSTGCTMGKANIEIQPDDERIEVEFQRGERKVTISVINDFLKTLEKELEGRDERTIIDYASRIMDTSPEEMFEVHE